MTPQFRPDRSYRGRRLSLAALTAVVAGLCAAGTSVAVPDPSPSANGNSAPSAAAPQINVSWSAPRRGARVLGALEGARCQVRGSAGVRRVTFYADGVRHGIDRRRPFRCRVAGLSRGRHVLRAVATAEGTSRDSATISFRTAGAAAAGASSPTVSFKAPTNSQVVSGTMRDAGCEALASDPDGIKKVIFSVDGQPLNTELSSPYNCVLDTGKLTDGTHTLAAVAYDKRGNQGSTGISVNVQNGPTLSWRAPTAGQTVSALLTGDACEVQANDRDGIDRVVFTVDGTPANTELFGPYNCVVDTSRLSNGSHRLTSVAYDKKGFSTTRSISINVDNSQGPALAWKTPSAGQAVSGTLSGAACEVSASSASGIDRVGFAVDGRGLNTELSAPYNCVVDTTQLSAGTHTLTAVAHDETGKSSSRSQSISVGDSGGGTPSDPPSGGTPTDPGSLLFNGDFDSGNASQWGSLQCNAGRFGFGSSSPSPLLGSGWMRFEVRQGDRETQTGSNRCEVADWRDGHYLRDGQEAWFRHQFYVSQWTLDPQNPWSYSVIWQLHPAAGVSPTLFMGIHNTGQLILHDGQRHFRYWTGQTYQPGRWYDVAMHVKNTTSNSTGFVELWIDGVPQTMANGQTRIFHATAYDDKSYPKLGIYRSPNHVGTTVMYGDGYTIGSTRASIGM